MVPPLCKEIVNVLRCCDGFAFLITLHSQKSALQASLAINTGTAATPKTKSTACVHWGASACRECLAANPVGSRRLCCALRYINYEPHGSDVKLASCQRCTAHLDGNCWSARVRGIHADHSSVDVPFKQLLSMRRYKNESSPPSNSYRV